MPSIFPRLPRNAYGRSVLDDLSRYLARRGDAGARGFDESIAQSGVRDIPHGTRLAVGGLWGVPLGLGGLAMEGDYSPEQRLAMGAAGVAWPMMLFGGYGLTTAFGLRRALREMGRVIPHSGRRFRKARDTLVRELDREGLAEMARDLAQARDLDELLWLAHRPAPPQRMPAALPPSPWVF